MTVGGFSSGSVVKNLPAKQETQVWSQGWKDPLEKEMATHSSILAWEIPRAEKPRRATVNGVAESGHDWATKQKGQLTSPEHHFNGFIL